LIDVLDRLGVALAGRYSEQAMVHLRRACRIWAEIDLPMELAQTRLLPDADQHPSPQINYLAPLPLMLPWVAVDRLLQGTLLQEPGPGGLALFLAVCSRYTWVAHDHS
jgi:hypothetical protein